MEVIAIDKGDPPEPVAKWARSRGFTFPIAMGGPLDGPKGTVFSEYGINAFPTNYVLDSNGKVVWRRTGYEVAGLRKALAGLGVK